MEPSLDMSLEQGDKSLGFSPDLQSKDQIDLRLHRAFRIWTDYKIRNSDQISRITELAPQQIADMANDLALSIHHTLGVEDGDHALTPVDSRRIEQLSSLVQGPGNRLIAIRHAEQSPPEWIFSIPRTDLRKIRMMQNPFNQQDLITNRGMAEVFSTSFVLLYLHAISGKNLQIVSSENSRALEVANVMDAMIEGSSIRVDEGLTCITYRDEHDEQGLTVEQILEELPTGFMPWDPQLVDRLCKVTKSGKTPSQAIKDSVGSLFAQGLSAEGDNLVIMLTHSQQLNEVLRLAGQMEDPHFRLAELSMLVLAENDLYVFPSGVIPKTEEPEPTRKKGMRRVLEKLGVGFEWYKIRRAEYETHEKIPFLVSPEPLRLSPEEAGEIEKIGKDAVNFMYACNGLYSEDPVVKSLLDRGKPAAMQGTRDLNYLFVRPDLLITENGFSICEIETSPFGLALAELLNQSYRSVNFDTLVPSGTLKDFLTKNTPNRGTIIYGQNTASYAGQLEFLASLLSGDQRIWEAKHIDSVLHTNSGALYRGFYLYEVFSDLFLNDLVTSAEGKNPITPSLTPHMEEKALMALLWDKRWEEFFKERLGEASFNHLRKVVPPTWIVGQEEFSSCLPNGISTSIDLASISKSKRKFVIKKSGFGSGSSWGEGVSFLQEKSGVEATKILRAATRDDSSLYIVQEFRDSQEREMLYEDKSANFQRMQARIRITPYFSMVPESSGQLLAIKATGCADTNYIHASTNSINTAVAIT